jgi:co-chaperonin GroES (HSP10)
MKAVNKFLLVNKTVEEKKSSSGLILTGDDVNKNRYQNGVVCEAVGNLVEFVKEGDKIMFDQANSHEVMIDGTMYTVIQERDVVVVL